MSRSLIARIGSGRRNLALVAVSVAACVAAGVLALVGTASASAPRAASRSFSCGNATLKGTYIYYNDGWLISGGRKMPFSIAGIDHFNGKGTGRGLTTFDVNGKVVNANTPETSTYTIRADCVGKIRFDTAGSIGHFTVYLGPSGRLASLIETDPGSVAGGTESRVAR